MVTGLFHNHLPVAPHVVQAVLLEGMDDGSQPVEGGEQDIPPIAKVVGLDKQLAISRVGVGFHLVSRLRAFMVRGMPEQGDAMTLFRIFNPVDGVGQARGVGHLDVQTAQAQDDVSEEVVGVEGGDGSHVVLPKEVDGWGDSPHLMKTILRSFYNKAIGEMIIFLK